MDPYIGEIRLLPFNFAPAGWLMCQGQTLPIRQYTALFSLLGTYYGGNGTTTFQLPNLQGNAVVGVGTGPGDSTYQVGQSGGTPNVTLNAGELPMHAHALSGPFQTTNAVGGAAGPQDGFLANAATEQYGDAKSGNTMTAGFITGTGNPSGGNGAHDNMMPYLGLNYCIALQGLYPPRN